MGVGQRGLNHLQQLVKLQSEEIGSFVALADPFAENLSAEKIKGYEPGTTSGGCRCIRRRTR